MTLLINPDEYQAFDMYLASVTSMQFHPGAGTREHKALDLAECRNVALQMLDERRRVFAAVVVDPVATQEKEG